MKNHYVARLIADDYEGGSEFHIGGFAPGSLMGPIGVLISYLINDEKKRRRRTWAWIGFGVFFV